MKLNKIKTMSKTGTKVLLFLILAVTLGFSIGCRSGGDDKGNGITDAEAVKRAKDALRIGYVEGDSAESVTKDVTLPRQERTELPFPGSLVIVQWSPYPPPPPNSEPITGTVTRPDDANTEVILTATLTKNDARDTRDFTLTVVPLCTTSELIPKLKADPPSLNGCSAASIRGADMPALRSAGVTSAQFLPVWSADADTGFTPAQLKAASVTIAEMRSHGLTIPQLRTGGIADYLVFNEACNTPQQAERETDNHPTITLTTTTLGATDTKMVLEAAVAGNNLRWTFSGVTGQVLFTNVSSVNDTGMLGSAIARLISRESGGINVSTLSIPLADIFSNPTVTVTDSQTRRASTQLCPGS